jgi:hypothetical protein
LGERDSGTVEVVGSTPSSSTIEVLMRDQRIMEMLEGRTQPQAMDIPLLERVVRHEISFYDSDEQEQIQTMLRKLLNTVGS